MLVDLPDAALEELTQLSKARGTSRAQLIRMAVANFLEESRPALKDSCGLWKTRGVDSLALERTLRSEWKR
jgi:metal-responsive CopG/Arc/MetJ family transcriptional regulator